MIRRLKLFYMFSKIVLIGQVVLLIFGSAGCTSQPKKIAVGMLAGAGVGAVVGYQFVHHGNHRQYETQNTIITSVVFALLTGGVLAWHYRDLEQMKVEISGRYARYRLCDPKEMQAELARSFGPEGGSCGNVYKISPKQIGKSAISLDDSTKWAYPNFRKRYLPPENEQSQLLSERYIWEIVRPGRFVTRSQNPKYFFGGDEK